MVVSRVARRSRRAPAPRRAARPNASPSAGANVSKTWMSVGGGGVVPVGRGLARRELLGVLGRVGRPGRGVGRRRRGRDLLDVLALPSPSRSPRRRLARTNEMTVTLDAAHLAVRGQGVVGPAQVRAGGVAGDRDAVVGGGGRERALDELLRGRGGRGVISEPPRSSVLRIRTSRNNAVGQPWLTDATWPGWALPQLKAPPSTQVPGPPTASMRAPELRRRRLVRRVADLAGQLAVPDRVEALPGELEVEALHVDRPRLVADDVQAVARRGRSGPRWRRRRRRAAARRWPSAGSGCGRGSRRRRSRWSGRR